MERRTSQLIYLLFAGWVFGAGSYEILQFPMDARSLALHNSASAYDGLLLSNNPASLSKRAKGNTYSYFYLPANIHFTGFQNVNHSSSGVRAYKISFMSYGAIIDGETEDKSYAFDILLESGFKKEYKNITSIGISGGYLFSSIVGYQSQLIFSNFGIRSRLLRKRLGVGFSLENIGFLIKSYTDIKEPIPALFRTALYYKPRYIPLIINGDMVTYLGDGDSFYFSGGIELKPNDSFTLCLGSSSHRSGYLTDDFSSDVIAGFSGGAGFRFTNMTLDVGFMNLGSYGFVVGFSLLKKLD
ncbi:MAG TPA: hypothetical protein EYN29_00400 [Candidatus Marinimicrobia bacterium]|nr:hypothetical protein [Candidatus Neomarinimicrobiota bacterium]